MNQLIKLNLGSGPRAVPGWINIDRSPNIALSRMPWLKRILHRFGVLNDGHLEAWDSEVIRGDIRHLKFGESTVDAVYTSHTLEHVYLADARLVLKEAFRVLRPGGYVRVALPDATKLAAMLCEAEKLDDGEMAFEFNRRLLAYPETRTSGVKRWVGLTGGHVHYWQPSPALVRRLLIEAGFREVTNCGFKQGNLPDLSRIETRPESFFLEAVKGS